MKRNYLVTTTLLIILIVLSVVLQTMYQQKFQTPYLATDPDTGERILINGPSSFESIRHPTVYNIDAVQKTGLSSQACNTISDRLKAAVEKTYGTTYQAISINTDSAKYDQGTATYTFKARLGDSNSDKYIYISVIQPPSGMSQLRIKDADDKLLENSSFEV